MEELMELIILKPEMEIVLVLILQCKSLWNN